MEINKRKLLLVDDDPSLLDTLSDFLRFEGYEVVCSPSGEDALVQLRIFQPDLIILDMGMPGMGGIGFLDRITHPDGSTFVPVLVLTARANMAEYFANKQIAGFLAKPCDPNDLLLEVGQILFLTASEGTGASTTKSRRHLVLAEHDIQLRSALASAFSKSGFDVAETTTGPEAFEACVTFKPDAIAMRLELDGMSADEIAALLKRLPTTRNITIIVYGMDLPEADLVHVANLAIPPNCMLKDLNINAIIDRVMSVT